MSITITAGGPPITVQATGGTVTLGPAASPVTIAASVGVPGPAGPAGPQGPPGASGAAGGSYVFQQSTPAASWTISHNLGFFPSLTVVDSAGSVVVGDVDYVDVNTVALTFAGAFSGTAYLS